MAETDEPIESPVSLDFDHDADTVWLHVGGFGTLHEWHPGVLACQTEGEHVGALRQVTLEGNVSIEERLIQLNPVERVQVYSMTQPGPPFRSYTSTIHVVATGKETCRVDWTARFRLAEGAPPAEVGAMLKGFYLSGLENLAIKLAR